MKSLIIFSLLVVCTVSFVLAVHRKQAQEDCYVEWPLLTADECRMVAEYTGDEQKDILACAQQPGHTITTCYMQVKYGGKE